MSLPEDLSQFTALVDIIARLRAPDGCPWDKKQTHASLRKNLLEECYEVLEALDEGNADKLCDELGDLLMQVVLHTQIAAEAGEFELGDVVNSINTKLIHRHPHVFGSKKVKNAEEVALNWEELKQEERGGTSILASAPKQMPALGYSQEIQRRVAQVGFDWEDIDGVIEKLTEEISELRRADSQERKAQECGDLLFTLANIARRLGIDLEAALRQANQRFYRRFSYMGKLQTGLATTLR
ncbi:Nucleoside triphosphate pyrophosphohydrolase/pyrophosphatase MazG [subsurface metagenome]